MWPAETLDPALGLPQHLHLLLAAAELCQAVTVERMVNVIIELFHTLKIVS